MYTWSTVAALLSDHAEGTCMRVAKRAVAHPVHAGLLATIDVPRGQMADYRLPLDARTWLHVSEFTDAYEVRRVEAPSERRSGPPAGHSGALLGLFVGLILGGTIGAAFAGAAVGAVAEAGAQPRSDHAVRRRRRGLKPLPERSGGQNSKGGSRSC